MTARRQDIASFADRRSVHSFRRSGDQWEQLDLPFPQGCVVHTPDVRSIALTLEDWGTRPKAVNDLRALSILLDSGEHRGRTPSPVRLGLRLERTDLDPASAHRIATRVAELGHSLAIRARRAGLARVGALEVTASLAAAQMSANGVRIDVDQWEAALKRRASQADERSATFAGGLGRAVLAFLRASHDGRVRPDVDPLATTTGRFGVSNPALKTLPRDEDIRACVVADPGCMLIRADYAHIDLRVTAAMTGDRRLLRTFEAGDCPHRSMASTILRKPAGQVTKDERQVAKAVNYGILYGMGARSLSRHAAEAYGVDVNERDARRLLRMARDSHAELTRWKQRARQARERYAQTRLGRRRWLEDPDDSYTKRLHHPIQGTASDGLKVALELLLPRLSRHQARLILIVDDEIILEAPTERASDVQRMLVQSMVRGMSLVVPEVRIDVQSGVGPNWAAAG